jgi:hypothetical protein
MSRLAISALFGFTAFLTGVAAVALLTKPSHDEIERPLSEPAKHVELPSESLTQTDKPKVKKFNEPKVTQSAIIHFPRHGSVRVEAVEQVGEFPKIVFSDATSHALLFQSSTEDPDGFLKPEADTDLTQPFLRFREVRSPGFQSPLLMAVAVQPGGSDNGFYLTTFGEINGKFVRLTDRSIDTAIQGGYYLGFLNQRLGFGLISWCFVWDFRKSDPHEEHYGQHYYKMTMYSLQNGKFHKILSRISKRKYDSEQSVRPLRELGINVSDQRSTIPGVKEFIDD